MVANNIEHGILLVNKPIGISSFDVIRILRKKIGIKKMGHSGTLDPFASGLLVILIGDAVKFQDYFMTQRKSYLANVLLGVETDTLDPTGEVIGEKAVDASMVEQLPQVIAEKFIGEIEQVPPGYSAIKVDGKRSYKLSRQGQQVTLKSRKVFIESFELIKIIDEKDDLKIDLEKLNPVLNKVLAVVKIRCGSGTYIRSIARDLARQVRTLGSLDWLERFEVGKLYLKDAMRVESIKQSEREEIMSQLKPVDEVIPGTSFAMNEYELRKVRHGNYEFFADRLVSGFNHFYYRNKLMVTISKQPDKTSIPFNLAKYQY